MKILFYTNSINEAILIQQTAKMTTIVPRIIEIEGADSSLPVLVVTTSFSEKSSTASTQVVLDNYLLIPNLNQKYKRIVIIERYPASFKERATEAFKASEFPRSEEDPHPEDINYQILALEVIDWLFTLGFDRIHLMGKCAGASLAQFIVQECENGDQILHHEGKTISIERLILCVPGCRTPELLLNHPVPLLCVWQKDDPQEFTWGHISKDPERYAKIFCRSNDILKTFPGNQHEIPVEVFSRGTEERSGSGSLDL